jgi:hypothetical protein
MRHILFLGIFFLFSCEDISTFDVDNPFDPQNPTYVAPSVTIKSGPSENEIINVPNTAFSWAGNTEGMSYRYFLDGKLKQDWIDTTSVLIDYLDEGAHQFGLQAKYPTGDATDTLYVNFSVEAVSGPSLLFFPRKNISPSGTPFAFQILGEEVEDLAAASFKLNFNATLLQIDSIIVGDYIGNNAESIFYKDFDNLAGTATVITALLGSNSPTFSGTASIAKIYGKVKSNGLSQIQFDGSETFRNINNEIISIKAAVGGVIDQE